MSILSHPESIMEITFFHFPGFSQDDLHRKGLGVAIAVPEILSGLPIFFSFITCGMLSLPFYSSDNKELRAYF